jgi:hypothetical protein
VNVAPEQKLSLRNERKACHFWVDNEVVDCYQTIIGADATWVYSRIARNAHGAWIVSPKSRGGDPRVSLREMAEWCGKSVDTVWRCLHVLQHVGLIRAEQAAKSKGRYALVDVKDLVLREGGEYDRSTGSIQLPAVRTAALKAEVKELRVRLARKTSGLNVVGGGAAAVSSVAQSDRFGGLLFSVPGQKCDSSVAQSDKTVAPERQPSITTRTQESKKEPPYPPVAAATGGDVGLEQTPSSDREIDEAVQKVMDAIGATARRLRKKLREQVARRVELGEEADDVADRMIAAHARLEKNSEFLFKVPSASEFFEQGLWLNFQRLNWDQKALREHRLRLEASTGSYM